MKTQNSRFTTIRRLLCAGAALLMAATAFGIGPIPFTATFDANGGEGGGSIQVPAGEPLVAPKVTRTGYKLAGWSPEVPATMPDGDVTYVAKWKATTYTVIFKKTRSGVKGKMKNQGFAYDYVKKLRKNKFRRNGWKFGGWATTKKDAKQGVVAYYNNQKVKNLSEVGGKVVLYAVWGKKPYKVKFCANGASGKMKRESFKYGKSKKLFKNKFKRSGYVFKGWATTKHGEAKYKDRQKVKNLTNKGKTVKLYAVWEAM